MPYSISVDTGGTFTDLVLANGDRLLGLYKAATTPADPFTGVQAAIDLAAMSERTSASRLLGNTATFVYATTFSTNAILQGRTARTALLTTAGHPDVLLFREGGKTDAFDPSVETPEPYVPRALTFEISERILSDGTIDTPLNEEQVMRTLERLEELEVEAVAVCLLWSLVNAAHEKCVGKLIEERLPETSYSLSHAVNPILREYRRASATAIDASIKPLMQEHLQDFDHRLRALGFRGEPLMVTHVTGGVLHFPEMAQRPLYTVDSGPVMAPLAARAYVSAEVSDEAADTIVIDTGGTSFDVSLLRDGEIVYTAEKWLGPRYEGHMTGLAAVDCRSIGAGGGSIAWVDSGGLLHVGPESAGAEPGPACYGKGGEKPTVTDAAVVLGYINPTFFLGGTMPLDAEAAANAIDSLIAHPLGLTVERAAEGVLVVAAEEMQKFIHEMTVGQGLDPRECLLVAGGGASGLLAPFIARALGIGRILVPSMAAGLSAAGCQFSDLIADFRRAVFTDTGTFQFESVATALNGIDDDLDGFFAGIQSAELGAQERQYLCGARYARQVWELDVPFERSSLDSPEGVPSLEDAFHKAHQRVFAVSQPGEVVECLSWRGRGTQIRLNKPAIARPVHATAQDSEVPVRTTRQAYFGGANPREVEVYFGPALEGGTRIKGPAVVEEWATTLVLIDRSECVVTDRGNYVIEIETDA